MNYDWIFLILLNFKQKFLMFNDTNTDDKFF